MDIIIIEGLDNTGKSTIINDLTGHYEKNGYIVKNIHCTKPPKTVKKENLAAYMDNEYSSMVSGIISDSRSGMYDMVIIDRCWYSECVYGPVYRDRNPEETVSLALRMEKRLIDSIGENNIGLILFDVDNPEFCIKHEDGFSLSESDIEKIKYERDMFKNIYGKSAIKNKAIITVNNGLLFKSEQIIFNAVLNKLGAFIK